MQRSSLALRYIREKERESGGAETILAVFFKLAQGGKTSALEDPIKFPRGLPPSILSAPLSHPE